jgi:isopentenyl-diphosphate delta-isomerase
MQTNRHKLIAIDEDDNQTGLVDKLEAHRKGILHRAFSVFVLNDKNELLLQQRAMGKYHSAGLWSNTCCSHPMQDEDTLAAAHRRLQEEMGFDCPLEYAFSLRYEAEVGNGLTENELDHVYIGHYTGKVDPNPDEVKNHRFMPLPELNVLMTGEPGSFTKWFHLAMPKLVAYIAGKEKAA